MIDSTSRSKKGNMSQYRRDTIHLSLGSTANAISAHLLNLQGLAATSQDQSCDAEVTHSVQKEFYVPRCLFVEEGEAMSFHEEGDEQQQQPIDPYLQAANVLAHSQYSRYRAPKQASINNSLYSTSNGRHVNWDEDEEEEEEEDEEDAEERLRRQERMQSQWQSEVLKPLQQQLEDHWNANLDNNTAAANDSSSVAVTSDCTDATMENEVTPTVPEQPLDYKTFLAPPHPHTFFCTLPFSSQSKLVDTWDAYNTKMSSNWTEDVLLERLRHLFENSDGVQGITIATEGHGLYAGLTTTLLQELQDECRTAGRMVLHVTDPPSYSQEDVSDTWQPAHVLRVRKHIESGLSFLDMGQLAHSILPLSVGAGLKDMTRSSVFDRTSEIAMAWETATLAYRGKSSKIRIASELGEEQLSVREFISSLQPTPRHKLLELDYATINCNTFSSLILPGTSVERRQLQGKRPQPLQIAPGAWMESTLQTLSPNDGTSRALHHHWSLAASMRSSRSTDEELTCVMEGMGIRYRPESAFGVFMGQTVHGLTLGGYAAGAYWKAKPSDSVVSILSNSTRSFDYAKTIATGMKESLSFKFQGYHNRDTTNGILPEREDCLEALEYCLGVKETYHPPEGSGLAEDAEGTYFDDEYY